jgi:hypothetical protein
LAERYGVRLGMWFGAGYPRSGTTYLCQLMSSCLDLPLVREYRLPVLMPCVVHSHWLPGRASVPTVYVVRDGRDVVVSRYFYEVNSVTRARNPRGAADRRRRFERLYGRDANLSDAAANLPAFIEAEMTKPQLTGVSWPEHVRRWLAVPGDHVAVVRYEDLVADTAATLGSALDKVAGGTIDRDYVRLAGERFDAEWQRRREAASHAETAPEQTPSGWRHYFTPEATDVFDRFAGDELRRLGYS